MTTEDTGVRDRLALTRTELANERTLLAYLRTALAMEIAGVGALKLFTHGLTTVVGWMLIAGGIMVLLIGAVRYRVVSRQMRG